MRKVITIDGPSGVGKGTLSYRLAKQHGWAYLDSGALYRLSALEICSRGLEEADAQTQAAALQDMQIDFRTGDNGMDVYRAGKKVSGELRLETTGQAASKLAAKPEIRTVLLEWQRQFAGNEPLIADGRDMGTVVFPEAQLKIFLDADSKTRAERRYKQLLDKGECVNLAALEKEIAERDVRDRNRTVAPLKPASDAVVINTAELSADAVLEKVNSLFKRNFF